MTICYECWPVHYLTVLQRSILFDDSGVPSVLESLFEALNGSCVEAVCLCVLLQCLMLFKMMLR